MIPDTGERYSALLFADVPADMTDEELAISRSTPNRFDVPQPRRPGPGECPASAPARPPTLSRSVAGVIGDAAQPVVMFALEW
jgi:cysteine synthase A